MRRHWRATVILGVGLGIAMAVPMSAWVVARRTDGAFPAFVRESFAGLDGAVAQGLFCPEGVTEEELVASNFEACFNYDPKVETERLAARPDVIAATRLSWVIGNVVVPATGQNERQGIELFHSDPVVLDGEFVSFGNGEGRGRLIDGRLADFSATEVVVNEAFVDHFGLRAGDTVSLSLYSQDEFAAAQEASTPPSRPPIPILIAGVMRWPTDLLSSLGGEGNPHAQATKIEAGSGLLAAFGGDVATFGKLVSFVPRPGVDAESLVVDEFGDRPHQIDRYTDLARDAIATIQRSTHLQANGVRVFAAATAIAAAVFGGQILIRQLRREIGTRDTLAALGWRNSDIRVVALLRMSTIGLISIATAIAATYLSSPIGSIGVAQRADFGATFRVDWLVIFAGVVGIAVVATASALLGARRLRTKTTSLFEPFARALGLASSISPAARLGAASLWPVGSARVQAARRTSSASCFTAAAVVVAAAVLVGSLTSLIDTPRNYGFPWDVQVGRFEGSPELLDEAIESIEAIPEVSAASLFYSADFARIGDNTQSLIAFGPVAGYSNVTPTITEGHAPLGVNEVALGRPLADKLNKHIGDTIEVLNQSDTSAASGTPSELTIVGYSVVMSLFPTVEPRDAVLVHYSMLEEQGGQSLLLDLRDGEQTAALERLRTAFPNTFARPIPPISVLNLDRTAGLPTLIAIVVGVLASATVVHALIIISRGSRRDMTMLRVFGATATHARSSMFWLATALTVPALVLGAIVGLVGGRVGWQQIARQRALDQVPTFAQLAIALVIVGGILIANLVAWLPARRATNDAPGTILRAE